MDANAPENSLHPYSNMKDTGLQVHSGTLKADVLYAT